MIRIENTAGTPIRPFWNNVHFHPTDAIEDDWGKNILDRIASDHVAGTVRLYAMLEDIVTRDENGVLHYDFSLSDQRIEYLLSKGFGIFLSYNFIPPFLAVTPQIQTTMNKGKTRYKGKFITASYPNDYGVWEEICYQYTAHNIARFGKEEVEKWYLQCYNEPNGRSFFMAETSERMVKCREYLKLYEYFQRGALKADENLKIGGPSLSITDPYPFFEKFVQEVASGRLRADFFGIHTYGTKPEYLNAGTKPFDVKNTLVQHEGYVNVLSQYFDKIPEIIVDEWGACASGFQNREECPTVMFREKSEFAAYFGKMITLYLDENVPVSKMLICLSGQHEMKVDFSGFRNFFTLNGFRKPIYNAFVMAARLFDTRVPAKADHKDLSVLATKKDDKFAIFLSYASAHFDRELPAIDDVLVVGNIGGRRRVTVSIIDREHTNPYAYFLKNGMSDELTLKQIAELRREGELKPVFDGVIDAVGGELRVPLRFTSDALVLVEVG